MRLQPGAVGVVCALAIEARHFARTVRPHAIHRLADGTLLYVSGIGAEAAARGAAALVDAGAGALLSWGLAGGLDPALRAGTPLLPSEVATQHGVFATSAAWRGQVGAAFRAHGPILRGTLYTAPFAIASVAEKAALFESTGACAVDMEGAHVAAVAAARGIPFIALKVIVDGAADALPPAISAAVGAAQLRLGRLAWALARSPGDLGSLWRLGQRYRSASRTLAAAARAGFAQPADVGSSAP
jgi:nucleoside phosphorylase